MDSVLISDAERFYLIQGCQLGCRLDGRNQMDFRPIEVESGILNHTAGSARIKIGNTVVIACVSVEIGNTTVECPNEGRIEIDVECSPTATPKFSGKCGSDIADTLKANLFTAFAKDCLPLKFLCIQSGKQCWIIHVDVLLLESDGNLLDAASLSIVAALSTMKLPMSLAQKLAVEKCGALNSDGISLSTNNLPTFVTVHKIGESYIVDTNKEEEACSFSRVFVAVRCDGTITTIIKEGCGSQHVDSLINMVSKHFGIEVLF
ncbi:unnamed protein product [Rodentolepis nana]|uniref:Ribosomal RNA-processing protein 42 n=1 Tax=Rodentolepis nana TaxID=102285 RepID=A0A0R3T1N3_RODNA|nr:unnamed protein product [Rodentolepis nana]